VRRRVGPAVVEEAADGAHHVEVGALAAAAEQVRGARRAVQRRVDEAARVVLDVEPVAHVGAGP
jgi:hypothetical protein